MADPIDPNLPKKQPVLDPEEQQNPTKQSNVATKGGTKPFPGLPPAGSTHLPQGKIAPALAGDRSAIERGAPTVLTFINKYQDYYGRNKRTFGTYVEDLVRDIKKFDDVGSDRAYREWQSISDRLYGLYQAISEEIAKPISDKLWPQYFKHNPDDLRAAIRKARRGERYQKDLEYKVRVDKVQDKLDEYFGSLLKKKIEADPQFKELESDWVVANGANGVMRHGSSRLNRSTTDDKIAGKRKPRPWGRGEDKTVPQIPHVGLTTKHRADIGLPSVQSIPKTPAELDDEIQRLQNIKARTGYLAPADRQKLKDMEFARARAGARSNFNVRKKTEEFERFLQSVQESVELETTEGWWSDI
jgi:hypothetical protein